MATEIVYMVVYQHYSISKNIIKLNVCCSVPCYNNQVTGISNTAGIMLTKYLGRFAPQLARIFFFKKVRQIQPLLCYANKTHQRHANNFNLNLLHIIAVKF